MKANAKLTDIRPQRVNLNDHTPRGLADLERSLQKDGWIGAISVAANNETFDGSARIEVGANCGFDDAIIIDSDGTKPIIVRRTDIPHADDERARRLGIAANRIAELNLHWNAEALLAESRELTKDFFSDAELEALANLANVPIPEDEDGGGSAEVECPNCHERFVPS